MIDLGDSSGVVVSGSTCTLGRILVSKFKQYRIPLETLDEGSQAWRLGQDIDSSLRGKTLIHLAHDRSMPLGTTNLVHSKLISKFESQVIFVSSLSAFPGTLSKYGQQKLAVEEIVLEYGGQVIKSGVMHGEILNSFTDKLKPFEVGKHAFQILPRLNKNFFWLTDYDLIVRAIFNLLHYSKSGVFGVYAPVPLSFKALVRKLSKRDDIIFFPFPDVIPRKLVSRLTHIESLAFLDSYLTLLRDCPPSLVSEWYQNSLIAKIFDLQEHI